MAHFLGTVVANEAPHAHPDLHVYLLVTLGSPPPKRTSRR
jgi:hypothetical protein